MPLPAYVWRPPHAPLSVHFHLAAARKLSLEAMGAWKSVPRRGLEIGGLLLGSCHVRGEQTEVHIEDFICLQTEHRSGPSFLPSENDYAALKDLLAQHSNVVGVFRSQTRTERLSLHVDDVDFLENCIIRNHRVFVLLEPKSGRAAYFLPDNGALARAHTFGLRTADFTDDARRDAPESKVEQFSKGSSASAVASPASDPRRRRRWKFAVAGVAATAAVIFAGITFRSRPSPSISPHSDARSITLDLHRQGPRLVLKWNPNDPLLKESTHAQLNIQEGNSQSQITLSKSNVATGEFSYWPESGDVRFRMEAFSPQGTATESVRYLAETQTTAPQPARAEAKARKQPEAVLLEPKMPPVGRSGIAVAPAKAESRPSSGEAERAAPLDTFNTYKAPLTPVEQSSPVTRKEATPLPPPPTTPAPKMETPTPPAELKAVPFATGISEPYVAVTAEPVEGSALSQAFKKIPLLGRLRKSKPPLTGPVPIKQAKPTLSAGQRDTVTRVESVDVHVYVSDTGKVEFAEPSGGSDRQDLTAAAVSAARQWQFAPARLGSENVPGEAVLHFVFVPPLNNKH